MKMDMSAKPEGEESEGVEKTDEGNYSQEEMECMLRHFVEAKKIESDPKLYAMIKDYALSKNKMVEDLFNKNDKNPPPKSLKDLKSLYNSKVTEE